MTKTFEDKAREWLEKRGYPIGAWAESILTFAIYLDEEAQEKPSHPSPCPVGIGGWSAHAPCPPCTCKPQQPEEEKCEIKKYHWCNGIFMTHTRYSKPQQPENIARLDRLEVNQYANENDELIVENRRKINELVDTLNRLTHKD